MFADHRSVRHGPARIRGALALTAFAVLVLLAAGCETRQEWLTKSRIRKVEHGLLRAIFLKGQQPEKLSLTSRMQFYKVPGAGIAVLDRNRLEWARSYGVRDEHSREPVTAATIFQAGALGRPVAAAAALELVDKGRLELDGDVNSRLRRGTVPTPEPGSAGKVTLRGLLSQDRTVPALGLPGYAPGVRMPSLVELLDGGVPSAPPAAEVQTDGAGYAYLQALLEDVTARVFPALAKESVLDPLGLKNSTFEAPLSEAMRIDAASGHGRDGRPEEGKWLDHPAAAASGFWSTPSDLAAFASDILETATGKGGRALSAGLARAMLTPQSENRSLGFVIDGAGQDVRFHLEGRTRGFRSALVVYPYKGQGVVVMTNSENGALLIEEIMRAVAAAYEWPDYKPLERPLFRLDPSIYRQYVGRYQVTPEYTLDVAFEDYYLVIRPTGQAPTRFFVESQTFFFSIDPYVRIQFTSDEQGRVTGLVLWQQDFKQEAKKVD
jgi:CubicO group peptidase (beta-lactamase class C family)